MKGNSQRRISVSMPDSLISEADRLALAIKMSRSEIIALAVKNYIDESKKIEIKEQMKKGYLEMGRINLSLAEDSLISDESACEIYEEFLSESE